MRMREVGGTANAIALSVPEGTITCKAAVAYGAGQKLVVEDISVEPPRKGEVPSHQPSVQWFRGGLVFKAHRLLSVSRRCV